VQNCVVVSLSEFSQEYFYNWLITQETGLPIQNRVDCLYYTILRNKNHENTYSKLLELFLSFTENKIEEKLKSHGKKIQDVKILGYKFRGIERTCSSADPIAWLSEQIMERFVSEFGKSGFCPQSGLSSAIRDLRVLPEKLNKHEQVSKQSIKEACVLCRSFEGFVDFFFNFLTLLNDSESCKEVRSERLVDKIGCLQKLTRECLSSPAGDHPAVRQLSEVINEDVISNLHNMRLIRNKIAHPKNISIEDIKSLSELSRSLFYSFSETVPLLARIMSIKVITPKAIELFLYSEADTHSCKPLSIVAYESCVLKSGGSTLRTEELAQVAVDQIGKTCIVFPYAYVGGRYQLRKDYLVILLMESHKLFEADDSAHQVAVIYEEVKEQLPILTESEVIE